MLLVVTLTISLHINEREAHYAFSIKVRWIFMIPFTAEYEEYNHYNLQLVHAVDKTYRSKQIDFRVSYISKSDSCNSLTPPCLRIL